MLAYTIRSIWTETFKLKRSLVLTVALVIPLFPAFANVAEGLQRGLPTSMPDAQGLGPWSVLFLYAFKLWTIFAMPMITAILSALLANTEHNPKTWKLLFALPFPRQAVFAGKWFALAGLVLLSNLVFALANLAGGVFILIVRPDAGLSFPIPVWEALAASLTSWLLSFLIISIHLWIALRWTSFLPSIVIGFAATVSNLFLISSYLFERVALSPWAMPVQVYGDWQGSLPIALGGAVLVSLLAGREFVRRDIV